jgi:hypothetical protein
MTKANRVMNDAKTLNNIEKDLVTARREGRFEDSLHHLDEIFVLHMHAESDPIKARCAALLAAPETLQKAA